MVHSKPLCKQKIRTTVGSVVAICATWTCLNRHSIWASETTKSSSMSAHLTICSIKTVIFRSVIGRKAAKAANAQLLRHNPPLHRPKRPRHRQRLHPQRRPPSQDQPLLLIQHLSQQSSRRLRRPQIPLQIRPGTRPHRRHPVVHALSCHLGIANAKHTRAFGMASQHKRDLIVTFTPRK